MLQKKCNFRDAQNWKASRNCSRHFCLPFPHIFIVCKWPLEKWKKLGGCDLNTNEVHCVRRGNQGCATPAAKMFRSSEADAFSRSNSNSKFLHSFRLIRDDPFGRLRSGAFKAQWPSWIGHITLASGSWGPDTICMPSVAWIFNAISMWWFCTFKKYFMTARESVSCFYPRYHSPGPILFLGVLLSLSISTADLSTPAGPPGTSPWSSWQSDHLPSGRLFTFCKS